MRAAAARIATIATALAGMTLVGGCAGIHAHRGAVVDPQLVSAIQVGTDNKDSVQKILGRPTFTSEFTPNDWYYVSRDTFAVAFRNPHVQKETMVHVRFDQNGNVASIDKTGKELVENIHPAKGQTPTAGRKRSFLEDLFGGIGTVGGAAGGSQSGGQGGGTGPQ